MSQKKNKILRFQMPKIFSVSRLPKLPWRGFLAGCFFIFFLLGILTANWVGKEKLMQYGMMNQYYIGQIAYMEWDSGAFFRYLLKRRFYIFGISVLFVYTKFGVFMLLGVIGWYSFSLGYLFVNALVCMGIQGMIVVLISVFPQIFCYAAAYYGLAKKLFGRSQEIVMPIGIHKAWKNPKLFLVLSAALCMFAGVWLEGYVNPLLLKAYIQRM